MPIDLSTLYDLIIGTLLVALAMTLRERQGNPHRARVLGFWAAACMTLAVGCLIAVWRGAFPGILGAALAKRGRDRIECAEPPSVMDAA